MRSDFCAFILSHGRPDRVLTHDTLRKAGYTGKIYIVIDDEDKTGDQYRQTFGDIVLTFSKQTIASTFDEGDNFDGRRGVIYARNACFNLAKNIGVKYFIQLDDDYTSFSMRWNGERNYGYAPIKQRLDDLFYTVLSYFIETPRITSIALSQGGDHMGTSKGKKVSMRRKAMNSFFCSVDRPFRFVGRVNEDTTTYTLLGREGSLFLTVLQAQLNQVQTQINQGGMTEIYLDQGTYVKSFYSVMYAPSCVQVGEMGDPRSSASRMHHVINWHKAVPLILREEVARRRHQREA